MKDLIQKIEKTIHRYNMIEYGARVLVAVSGGADSVVLLDLLKRLQGIFSLDLVVAHFDHGLRPRDDETETRFVASLAASMDLAFVTEKCQSPLANRGKSLEEAARDQRYAFLHRVKTSCAAQTIALGHTLDDQAETVMMRLLRGSGPAGLSGIPPVRDPGIVRPLIEVTRKDIEAYIDQRDLQHMTDPSNLEKRYLRNRIRWELLPLLETYQPRIAQILGQTAEIMREETRWMEEEADRWIDLHVENHQPDTQTLSLKSLEELAPALQNRVIRQVIRRVQGGLRRIQMRHVSSVKSLAKGRPQARLNLPKGVLVKRAYDVLLFTKKRDKSENREKDGFYVVLKGPGVFRLNKLRCTVTIDELERGMLPTVKNNSPWVAHLDRDSITYPLVMRHAVPGDRFVPLGMTGHKKIKDFFVDEKIPSRVRKSLPLLCRGKDLVWVCGLRIDERFKVQLKTKKVIRVTLSFSGGPLADFSVGHPSKWF